MKRNLLLSLGLIVIFVITAWSVYGRQKQTTITQQWEYKTIAIWRATGADFTRWWDSGVELPAPVSPLRKLNELGAEGWELIATIPIANTANSYGTSSALNYDQSGFTNQISYILKRPKQ